MNDSGGRTPLVKMNKITRTFSENGVVANRSVDLDIEPGEIHALVGENGSGKSTLMHILSGVIRPDGGTIELRGRPVRFSSPADALKHGIGLVPQHVRIIRDFTVLENIILGKEPRDRFGQIDYKTAAESVTGLMEHYGLELLLHRPASRLSVDGIQKTALLSLLHHGLDLIILDEPTTLFKENQDDLLYSVLQKLRSEGHTLVLITHKLREALGFSDRISVMRDGALVATYRTEEMTRERLARLMVGDGLSFNQDASGKTGTGKKEPDDALPPDEALLRLDRITYKGEDYPPLRSVSFDVYPGETVAVTGIRENGLETLEQVLAGFVVPSEGELLFKGEAVQGTPIGELRRKKIAYIPTERLVRGASMDSSVAENMIILNYRDFHSWGTLKKEEIEHFAGKLRRQFNIKADAGDRLAGLSGGNIQRVIISREFSHAPELLIFSEPSWGLDIAGRRFILEKIDQLKAQGSAVLVITSDLEEALESADRIVVMYRGKVGGIVRTADTDRGAIGRMMLGIKGEKGYA